MDDNAIGFVGNNRRCAMLDDLGAQPVAVVALVGEKLRHEWRERQDIGRRSNVGILARGQVKDDWPAERIAQPVDLGRAPTARARWPDFAPPFSAGGAAMSLDRGGVERQRDGVFAELRQSFKDRTPSATFGPAVETIVDCRVGAIFGWAIAPTSPRFQHMNDAADELQIVVARG